MHEAGFRVEREPVDLVAVARAVVDRHAMRARELGVTLTLDAPAEASGTGDAERLIQAVSNLVENALRVGASVTVRARPGRIEVVDDGPGLDPDDLPHAFERFYLHERLRSDRQVGTGLGLAIVEQLVSGMGGTATVASEPGRGTRFELEL